MSDREKLMGSLYDALLEIPRYEVPQASDIADHLISHGVVVREWIPVTERLPKNGRYLICRDFDCIQYVGVATYAENLYQLDEYDFYHYRRKKKGGFVDSSSGGYYELTHITHWMPLPEPPMRKGENG